MQTENRLMDPEPGGTGEGEGGTNGERSMETYTPLYVKHMASRNLLLRELKPGLRDNLERWDGVGDSRGRA